jgi:putative glutathione S-transferase
MLQDRAALADPSLVAMAVGGSSMLINGQWSVDGYLALPTDEKGEFIRQISSFRDWITPDGSHGPGGQAGFRAEPGRYHLIVALSCPWASRTLIARKLKGLEQAISLSVAEPGMGKQGWGFGAGSTSGAYGFEAEYLHELYTRADPQYTGRATVPVLWDKQRQTIVNNESADILRIFNSGFGDLADPTIDLYPEDLLDDIDALNDRLYRRLNNGVYRAGFAKTQQAYEAAFLDVFEMLDELEGKLTANGPFLFGERFTETDIRLFVTLIRFDAAYFGLFKCNLRRLVDYAALSAYLSRMLDVPGIRETVSIDHIKRGYYSIKFLNPNGIVPMGPDLPGIQQFSALCRSWRKARRMNPFAATRFRLDGRHRPNSAHRARAALPGHRGSTACSAPARDSRTRYTA